MLPFSLGVPDVHWLSLDPRLEGLIVPSKFYGIAAAGRPMVMIGDSDGEIGRLVRQYRCGISVAPCEAADLAANLRRWSQEPQTIAQMGLLARQMLEARFTRRASLARWSQLLDQLTANWELAVQRKSSGSQ